ncbi:MAG: DUF2169 domain-containing protein [Lentisphaerota bacterium]
MDLENLTGFPAKVMAGGVVTKTPSFESLARSKGKLPEGVSVRGLLIVKCTLDYKDGAWTPAKDPFPIWDEDEQGPPFFEKDIMFQKDGLDLAIIGSARAPSEPVTQMTVSVAIGAWSRRLAVFGPRFWFKRLWQFVPSDPQPFTEMPIILENAYGGETVDEKGEAAVSPMNPVGKGYTFPNKKSQVEGVPLPNIEDPAHLISDIQEKPDPVGFGFLPVTHGLRLCAGLRPKPGGGMPEILLRINNAAYPGMTLPRYPAGETLEIEGMTVPSPWRAKLPAFPAQAELKGDGGTRLLPLEPDTLCLLLDQRRMYITAKGRFDYDLEHPPTLTAVVRPKEGGA